VATLEVGVRGVDLTVLEFVAKVVRAVAIKAVMTVSETVLAVTKGIALFNVVPCLTAPITDFVVVFAPGMYGLIADGDLSLASSLAFEIGGLVHVAVNAATDAGDGIGGGKSFRALVHSQSLGLQRLFENSNATSNLYGLGVVGAEVLYFSDECCIVFFAQGPVDKVSELHTTSKE